MIRKADDGAQGLENRSGAGDGARAPWGRPLDVAMTMETLPAVVDAAWWQRHRHLFSWSSRKRVLKFVPGFSRHPGARAPRKGVGELVSQHRPERLAHVIGQQQVVKGLRLAVQAARLESRPLGHVLLEGPPGLGKTSLAVALAREMGAHLHRMCGASMTDPGLLLSLLTSLGRGDVVLLDEIHSLPRKLCKPLYQAMQDAALSLPVVEGPQGRHVTIKLQPFTLVGATTDPDRMPGFLRECFCLRKELVFYEESELVQIINRAAARRTLDLQPEGAVLLARAAQGNPRTALRLVAQMADLVLVRAPHAAGLATAWETLKLEGLDAHGLELRQRKVLAHLKELGRPESRSCLAARLGVGLRTFKLIVEPDLIRLGLVTVTPRGLVATVGADPHAGRG